MLAVSVVVPARNAAATLGETLRALAAQDLDAEYEVIVVDNGSGDDTATVVAAAGDGVRLVQIESRWPGEARNAGAAKAGGAKLAFTDADCVPRPDWLREGLAALSRSDLVQGGVIPDPEQVMGPFDRSVSVSGEALYETANLFVSRQLFERLGGFDDWMRADFDRPFGEDVWFGWRARRSGARTTFCPAAVVHHAVFAGDPRGYIDERRRVRLFPALVARVPELRTAFLFRRWFLSARSAAFDAAVLGGAAGVSLLAATDLPAPLAAIPLLASVPYLRRLARRALPWGRRAPLVAGVEIIADAVACGALVTGSLRSRSAVL